MSVFRTDACSTMTSTRIPSQTMQAMNVSGNIFGCFAQFGTVKVKMNINGKETAQAIRAPEKNASSFFECFSYVCPEPVLVK